MKVHSNRVHLSLRPNSIAFFLSAIAVFLILASIIGQSIAYLNNYEQLSLFAQQLIRIFELGSEHNIPTHFSALLILFSALLLFFIFFVETTKNSWSKTYWLILAGGFFFMAADETYQVHEKLIDPVQHLLPGTSFGIFYFAWVIPYFIIVLTIAVFFARFLMKIPSKTKNRFLIAAAIYLGGAIGIELIGGYYFELHGSDNFTYNMIQTVEESMEITGLIVFIWALLKSIEADYQQIQLNL